MGSPARHAVFVGRAGPAVERLSRLLEQAGFETERTPDPVATLDRLWSRPCDVLIVNHPVAGLEVEDLIVTVRHPSSPSRATGLVLVVPDGELEGARSLIGRGANRVVGRGASTDELLVAVGDVLDPQPRVPVRALIHVEELAGGGTRSRSLLRTLDLSLTGVLIQGDEELAVGSRISFELQLPGAGTAIAGEARVVRRTDHEREGVTGLAATFVGFDGDGRAALAAYLTPRAS